MFFDMGKINSTFPVNRIETSTSNINIETTKYLPSETPNNNSSLITSTHTPSSVKSLTPDPTIKLTNTAIISTYSLTPTTSIGPLIVTFIDVGQGDSIFLISPDGKTALIDGGSYGTGVLDYLQKSGVTSLDIMIATHPHEDHIGGLIQVLESIPVKEVITNGQSHTTSVYEHFLDAIIYSKAEYLEVSRGNNINFGNLSFLVLNPDKITDDDLNQNSLVLSLTYGKITFMFMGDAGFDSEASILNSGLPVKAKILKIGHHGSCYSTSLALLDAVNPEVAIYSAGINNQFGHPCINTINELIFHKVLVLGTDIYGNIIVKVSDNNYSITNSAGQILRR